MVVVCVGGQALRGRRQCTWLRLLGAAVAGGGAFARQRGGLIGGGGGRQDVAWQGLTSRMIRRGYFKQSKKVWSMNLRRQSTAQQLGHHCALHHAAALSG